jgi:hypothetical protein
VPARSQAGTDTAAARRPGRYASVPNSMRAHTLFFQPCEGAGVGTVQGLGGAGAVEFGAWGVGGAWRAPVSRLLYRRCYRSLPRRGANAASCSGPRPRVADARPR